MSSLFSPNWTSRTPLLAPRLVARHDDAVPDADSRRRHAREHPRHPPDTADVPAAAVQDAAAPAADRQAPGARKEPRKEPRAVPVSNADTPSPLRTSTAPVASTETSTPLSSMTVSAGRGSGRSPAAMTMTGAGPS